MRAARLGALRHKRWVNFKCTYRVSFKRSLTSSGRDGGVRAKRIHLKPKSWDLVALRIDPAKPEWYIRDRIGAQHDYKGILFSQVLAFGRHDESRWFCSEICAAALDLPNPQHVSPQFLFDVVGWGHQGIENAW